MYVSSRGSLGTYETESDSKAFSVIRAILFWRETTKETHSSKKYSKKADIWKDSFMELLLLQQNINE